MPSGILGMTTIEAAITKTHTIDNMPEFHVNKIFICVVSLSQDLSLLLTTCMTTHVQ